MREMSTTQAESLEEPMNFVVGATGMVGTKSRRPLTSAEPVSSVVRRTDPSVT
jgi:hypothetical protein